MNVIEIPSEHEMFDVEVTGELSNFIFDKFVLKFTKENKTPLILQVFYDNTKDGISGIVIYLVKIGEEWIKNVCYKVQIDDATKLGYNVSCNSNEFKYLNIGFDIFALVIRVMLYIMNTPRKRITKSKILVEKKKEKQKKITKKENKIYLLDEIVDYVNERYGYISSRTHTIECPCWSVRGHYRHYKNGNVVFVKSYEKGKEKGKKKPNDKIYTI